MVPSNLTRKQLKRKTTEELEVMIENSPYPTRDKAIGNNDTIKHAFEILHDRKMIDCETAFCFEDCEIKNN